MSSSIYLFCYDMIYGMPHIAISHNTHSEFKWLKQSNITLHVCMYVCLYVYNMKKSTHTYLSFLNFFYFSKLQVKDWTKTDPKNTKSQDSEHGILVTMKNNINEKSMVR